MLLTFTLGADDPSNIVHKLAHFFGLLTPFSLASYAALIYSFLSCTATTAKYETNINPESFQQCDILLAMSTETRGRASRNVWPTDHQSPGVQQGSRLGPSQFPAVIRKAGQRAVSSDTETYWRTALRDTA